MTEKEKKIVDPYEATIDTIKFKEIKMKEIILEVIKLLKEYTEPPAKSQQQWKLFSIVKDVQKNNRKAPPWVGRGKNTDKQMISMMANKIPSGEVDKFLNVVDEKFL